MNSHLPVVIVTFIVITNIYPRVEWEATVLFHFKKKKKGGWAKERKEKSIINSSHCRIVNY